MFFLSHESEGFDIYNAYACGLASKAAYLAPELIGHRIVEEWKIPNVRQFNKSNVRGFVAASDNFTIVSFLGSERDYEIWQENIEAGFVPGPFGRGDRVHRGFYDGISQAIEEIEAKIDALGSSDSPLFLTGHSLGGAISNLTAAYFFQKSRPVHSVYTFGSPRVGCRKFRDLYKQYDRGRSFRIVNRHDIVARIPPRILRYNHVGSLRYLDISGHIHEDASSWDRLLLYLDPSGRSPKQYIKEIADRLPGALDDHAMDNYLIKLSSLALTEKQNQ